MNGFIILFVGIAPILVGRATYLIVRFVRCKCLSAPAQ